MRGNKKSSQTQYLYTFPHSDCIGVKKNSTGIEATILVQENWPILTSSTKRFKVSCSFKSSSFTVKAGLNLPTVKKSSEQTSELNEVAKALKYTQNEFSTKSIFYKKNNEEYPLSHIIVMVIFVISAIVGVAATAMWIKSLWKSQNNSESFVKLQSSKMMYNLTFFAGKVEQEATAEQQENAPDYENVDFANENLPKCLNATDNSSFV